MKRLTKEGIRQATDWIKNRSGSSPTADTFPLAQFDAVGLLDDVGGPDVDGLIHHNDRLQFGQYLEPIVEQVLAGRPDLVADTGMWSYIGITHIGDISQTTGAGMRLYEPARYLLDLDERRIYRHVPYLSFMGVTGMPAAGHPLLACSMSTHHDYLEGIMSSPGLRENQDAINLFMDLFWDRSAGHIERNVLGHLDNGNVRHFVQWYNGIALPRSTGTLTKQDLVSMLPADLAARLPAASSTP